MGLAFAGWPHGLRELRCFLLSFQGRLKGVLWNDSVPFGPCLPMGTAWDAIKLTLPGGWLHLSFRGHRPFQFRGDDGNYSELASGLMFDDFLPIPDVESQPFYPLVLKIVVCANGEGSVSGLHCLQILAQERQAALWA